MLLKVYLHIHEKSYFPSYLLIPSVGECDLTISHSPGKGSVSKDKKYSQKETGTETPTQGM